MLTRTGLSRRNLLASAAALAAAPLAGKSLVSSAFAAAPMLGSSRPTHYRFQLGAFEVTAIQDAAAMIDGPWPIVGENQPQADVEALMQENLLPEKKFQPGFTPMIVNTGKELILFEAGNGDGGFVPRPHGGLLAKMLGPAGFSPEQIDVVVLTHGHQDHVAGLIEDGAPLFPNARYVMGGLEYDFWAAKDRMSAPKESVEYQAATLFQTRVTPFADRMTFIKPDDEAAPGIRALQSYGHTPGHLSFHIESEGKRLLFWGDCAHHQVASLARPDWHALFDMDKEAGAATRKRIYDMAATERLPVAGYHMPFPSLGFVERHDGAYRWLPVSYQLDL